jgi:hypothetical protein
MTQVIVNPTTDTPTHDVALNSGKRKIGLQFAGEERIMQEIPTSPPTKEFKAEQETFIGGRGRRKLSSDPSGFYDGNCWTLTEEKLTLPPMWRFASGYRQASMYQPNSIIWKGLFPGGTNSNAVKRYHHCAFTTTSAYTATKAYIWVRKVGNPTGVLTLAIYASDGGTPAKPTGSALVSATIASSTISAEVSTLAEFSLGTTSLSATTTYHLVLAGPANDNKNNHWEVGMGATDAYITATIATPIENSTWTAVKWKPFFRIVDNLSLTVRRNRKWFPFNFYGGLYACHTSSLFQNGDRGLSTNASTTTAMICAGKSGWGGKFIGARVRIIDGTGDGQDRAIGVTSAVSGSDYCIVPDVAFDPKPDGTSSYLIYGTDVWTGLTSGLTAVTGKPVSVNKICYFPQGTVTSRKMRLEAGAHEFAAVDDGTTMAAKLVVMTTHATAGIQLVAVPNSGSTIQIATMSTVNWLTVDPPWGTAINIGTADTLITGLINHENSIYVFKEDMVYKMDGNTPKMLGKALSTIVDSSNGFASVTKDPGLWFSWGNSVQQLIGGTVMDKMNYKTGYWGLPADSTGSISALETGGPYLFCCIDGGASNYSSVLIWNETGWHVIFKGWKKGERIQNIVWQSNEGTRPRLWIFIGNDIVYMDFPNNTLNPLMDSGFAYHHEGVFETSAIDANDPILYKFIRKITLNTENMPIKMDGTSVGARYITIEVQLNNSGRWIKIPSAYFTPAVDDLINKGSIKTLRFRFILRTSTYTSSPVVTSWHVDGWMGDEIKYEYRAQYKAGRKQKTRDREDDHKPNELIAQLIKWSSEMTNLKLLSTDDSIHGKTVVISAPAISKGYVSNRDPGQWDGVFTLLIREA